FFMLTRESLPQPRYPGNAAPTRPFRRVRARSRRGTFPSAAGAGRVAVLFRHALTILAPVDSTRGVVQMIRRGIGAAGETTVQASPAPELRDVPRLRGRVDDVSL